MVHTGNPSSRRLARAGLISAFVCLLPVQIMGWPAPDANTAGSQPSDTFTVDLLLESPGHRPPYYVLSFGVQAQGTDGYDNGLDQQLPPVPPEGRDFEAYFPCDQIEKDEIQLVRDIRGEVEVRHVWMIVTHGGEGTLSWYPHTFPRTAAFLLNGLVDMRIVTSTQFSSLDTMTVTYNKPGAVPDIDVDQASYDFGSVLIGTSRTWTFPLRNLGQGDLVISGTTLVVPEFALVGPVCPFHINPLQGVDMTISFTPSQRAPKTDNLFINSNDPVEPTIFIALLGVGASPEMGIAATDHDFGEVTVGERGEWNLGVYNHGNWELMVDTLYTNHPAFTAHPLSFAVAPLDSRQVTLGFQASWPGPISGQLTLHSDDPDCPAATVSLSGTGIAPEIELSADTHDFGTVVLGDTVSWDLFVTNSGAANLIVDTMTATPEAFFVAPASLDLTPGGNRDITVFFSPLSVGPLAGQLRMATNDPDEPLLQVDLAGEGIEEDKPDLYLEEPGHDFGLVEIGHSALWSFNVINLGTERLNIENISITHSAFAAEPTVFSVSPGNLQEVRVTFAPTEVETVSAELRITSNDPDEPVVSISVLGLGTPTTGVEVNLGPPLPQGFHLDQNVPNPFNAATVIRYQIPDHISSVKATVAVYNILGRRIRILVDAFLDPGWHAVEWDGRDGGGCAVSSGLYACQLTASGCVETRMMLLLR